MLKLVNSYGIVLRDIEIVREHRYCERMGIYRGGMLDLEKQFAFYGSFHNHPVNVAIHLCFVWPIFFTIMLLLAYTEPLLESPIPLHEFMVLNYSFVMAAVFALFYVSLDFKSGSLAAVLVIACWMGSNAIALHVPYATGWKVCICISLLSVQ